MSHGFHIQVCHQHLKQTKGKLVSKGSKKDVVDKLGQLACIHGSMPTFLCVTYILVHCISPYQK